jgi:hypothetical protein
MLLRSTGPITNALLADRLEPPHPNCDRPPAMSLNVYTCTDHDGFWVGVASVVIAETEDVARDLLKAELKEHGLDPSKSFSLRRLNIAHPKAFVLQNGDY